VVEAGNFTVSRTFDQFSEKIDDQLRHLDQASKARHLEILGAVDSFVQAVKEGQLFPVLPPILTRLDPSLKSPALNGYSMIERAVLNYLQFPRMKTRELEIRFAYRNTCSWIFQDDTEGKASRDCFGQWLSHGTGFFWIEGKAGCGKSTLMKFLCADERTGRLLRR